MRKTWFARLVPAFVAAAWTIVQGLGSAAAQQQEARPQAPYRLAVRVELVNVDVSVSDARGNFVGDLKRENFWLLDEGAPQPITNFAAVEAPAQVLVLVETSPAVYLIYRQHLLAAYALLEGLAADDRVALGTYDQSPRLLLNLTADKNAFAQALGKLHYNLGMGELNLYDSLVATLEWLAPLPGKKAIVVLTTGLDTSPAAHWDELQQRLRASEVMVLPVALGGELRQPDKSQKQKGRPSPFPDGGPQLSFERADRALQTIAELTGGCAYFPKDAGDFQGIYRQIASLLRHTYSLGFKPPVHDARFHRIEVQVVDATRQLLAPLPRGEGKPAYRVNARPGYFAPAP